MRGKDGEHPQTQDAGALGQQNVRKRGGYHPRPGIVRQSAQKKIAAGIFEGAGLGCTAHSQRRRSARGQQNVRRRGGQKNIRRRGGYHPHPGIGRRSAIPPASRNSAPECSKNKLRAALLKGRDLAMDGCTARSATPERARREKPR